MDNEAVADLGAVLEDERQALRLGALAELPGIAIRKEALVSRLSIAGTTLPQWQDLLARANENLRLIGAALKGVHAARSRLQAMRLAAEGTTTYTAQGGSVDLDKASSKLEWRA